MKNDDTVELPLETLLQQIGRLAKFILEHFPNEPSRSEGAVDVAIRLLGHLLAARDTAKAAPSNSLIHGD